MTAISGIIKLLFSGSKRTRVVKANIMGSFAIKGLSVLISLLIVPLTISLLDQEKYGIWITIFSIVSWFNIMDVGIGNGFRNKFADALAKGKDVLAKEYMQTFYSAMALLSLTLFIILSCIIPNINWYAILNLSKTFNEDINLIVWIVFALFCLQLFTKNISTVLLSIQKTNDSNLLVFIGNLLSLIFIFILAQTTDVSLFSIALSFMIAPIIVFSFATFYYFSRILKPYKPTILALPQKKYFKDLIGLGLKFFFLQINAMILFGSSNIIITQLYGPAQVTPFSVSFRLFLSLQAGFTIILAPFWSAYTEANAIGDIRWIRKSIKRLITLWVIFSFFVFIFWIFSPEIISMWVGKEIVVSRALLLQFTIYVIIISWIGLFVGYINGVGKIKLNLYIGIVQSIVNIPLAIILSKYFGLNLTGIILSTNLILLISAVIMPIQYFKIISGKAKGVWIA